MSDEQIVRDVRSTMLRFYKGREEELDRWFSKPNYMLGRLHASGQPWSPNDFIERGQAKELLDKVDFFLARK